MLEKRSNEAELMDDLTIANEDLRRNLQELEVINNWLGGHKVVLDALNKILQRQKKLPDPLRIADIGSGGGDTLLAIARWARRRSISVQLIGIDANSFAVAYARQRCEQFPEISFEQHDVFSEQFAEEQYDLTVCSLFCHHFTDADLVQMFRQLHSQSRIGVIINDLHRHWLAYHSIKYITAFFSRSAMVKNDAPLSVWRAFKRSELATLVKRAGILHYDLRWMWAFRWQLLLKKP